MSEASTLIEKLGLDKDVAYKCVRRADCSNCLCDDARYSKCQLITPWGNFSREYPSRMALLMERLSEKMRDKDKTDWHAFPEEKPKKDNLYVVTINESFNGRSLTSASWWDSQEKQFSDFEDSVLTAWAKCPEPYKRDSFPPDGIWAPYPEEVPEGGTVCLTTYENERGHRFVRTDTYVDRYFVFDFDLIGGDKVVAWIPYPEPYKEKP